MIATLTLNPALDETLTVRGLTVDDVNRWTSLRRDPAGKGIDVSRCLHELGSETVAYGFIGGYDGQAVENLLRRQGVKFRFTHIEQDTRTNIIITDLKTRRQTRLDAPGPRVSREELEALREQLRGITGEVGFLVMSGSVPPGVPEDIYAQLVAEARSRGIRTALDSDGPWLKEGVKAKPHLIKPNVQETQRLLGRRLGTEEALIQAARELAATGIEVVAISRGPEGLIVVSGDTVIKGVPPAVRVRSVVGAGDCALAGLVLKLRQRAPLEEACRMGVAAGTAAVLTPGTQLARRADVERLLPQVRIERLARG